ncbi:MAG: TerB family tellurite resistance protein [Acidobacteria bacterium]|nr:TerB family tellurite resistance protein [Acidobacteriota bacterium]MCI0627155.1 TerB family tellurite resistance protein [Acidobacteriota bacterium]MCI0721931.1 TerB family tellurite resistance protein [Acidobacteriota bacterium]
MSIWDLFRVEPKQRPPSASVAETESVRRITNVLDQMEADRARFIAAFAYILSRVARSDQDVSAEETRAMERIVAEQGDFAEEQGIIVVQMAKMQNTLFSGIEDYVVTREFNGIATREQKMRLLHCLFAVSAANHSISNVEDATIRQIAKELKLAHKDFIDVRLHYRDHLDVLKG